MSKMVILTGATRGIGADIFKQLQNNNMYELCCLTRKTVSGGNVHCIHADFSSGEQVFIDDLKCWMEIKPCDEIILVLVASTIEPIEGVGRLNDINENVLTNVISQVHLVNTVVNEAQKNNIPMRIIQFDSGAAYRPISGWSLYCSSKAYMSMFLQTLALEHNEYKIVLFDPGVVDTGMQNYIRESDSEAFVSRDIFKGYKENNQLRSSYEVATYVVNRYVIDWKAETLKEKYKNNL